MGISPIVPGTITTTRPAYECPRHGEHDASMHVSIHGVLHRVYCLHCLVEVYDKLGIREMEPVKRKTGK